MQLPFADSSNLLIGRCLMELDLTNRRNQQANIVSKQKSEFALLLLSQLKRLSREKYGNVLPKQVAEFVSSRDQQLAEFVGRVVIVDADQDVSKLN